MSPERFVDAFHRHLSDDPNRAVALGVEHHLDELPDPSLEAAAARAARARELRHSADGLRKQPLGFDDRLDLDLSTLVLESEEHRLSLELEARPQLARLPSAGDDIGDGLFLLMAHDSRPASERLANATARLERVPEYLDASFARLDEPVARWVDTDLDRTEGLPDLFGSLTAWAERESFPDRSRLERASRHAAGAIERYRERLRALRTTKAFAVGEAEAARIVALRGIELSLEQLHAMARDFLAEVTEALDDLTRRLVKKYDLPSETTCAELQADLNRRFAVDCRHRGLSAILDEYRAELDRVVRFIEARKLFPIPADQAIDILKTPPFLEPTIPAGAMMSPAPFRAGTKKSLIYLTLSDALRDEHTLLSIPSMTIHEGIPGHHLQLATAAAHPSMIRRHVEAMDLSEGWTTMLEDYMLDIGYLADRTDEARFIGKRDIARIGARVAIDLYFMTGNPDYLEVGIDYDRSSDDPFARAGSLLSVVTGFTPERAHTELSWYSQERGYPLSYLTGNRLMWQLKRDFERAEGATGLDVDRRFFERVLSAGNMPVAYLERWLEPRDAS